MRRKNKQVTPIFEEDWVVVKLVTGCGIDEAVKEAIALAKRRKITVVFDFNAVLVWVEKNSKPKRVVRDWQRAMDGKPLRKRDPHAIQNGTRAGTIFILAKNGQFVEPRRIT